MVFFLKIPDIPEGLFSKKEAMLSEFDKPEFEVLISPLVSANNIDCAYQIQFIDEHYQNS